MNLGLRVELDLWGENVKGGREKEEEGERKQKRKEEGWKGVEWLICLRKMGSFLSSSSTEKGKKKKKKK